MEIALKIAATLAVVLSVVAVSAAAGEGGDGNGNCRQCCRGGYDMTICKNDHPWSFDKSSTPCPFNITLATQEACEDAAAVWIARFNQGYTQPRWVVSCTSPAGVVTQPPF